MQYLGYDVWVLGNHEFNFGLERLYMSYGKGQGTHGMNTFTGAVLSGNVYRQNERMFDPYMIRQFGGIGGPRVAIIGAVHTNITGWDGTKLLPLGISTRRIDLEVQEIISYLKSPQAEEKYGGKIDLFIVAQHTGTNREFMPGDNVSDTITMNGQDLTLVISAHSHNNVNEMRGSGNNRTRHVRIDANGANLGQVEIYTLRTANGWIVPDKENDVKMTAHSIGTTTDSGYLSFINRAHEFGRAYTNSVIGELIGRNLISGSFVRGGPNIRYAQYNALVALINDAMEYYTRDLYLAPGAAQAYPELTGPVTLFGNAPLSSSAGASVGPLTRGSITGIYQYDNNTLCVLKMTGHQFKRWMEWAQLYWGPNGTTLTATMGLNDVTFPSGGFNGYFADQFKGVLYEVDLRKPYNERIVNLRNPDGTPFDLDATYFVATNDYRTSSQLSIHAGQGSVLPMFPENHSSIPFLEPAIIVAANVETTLTVNGVSINNGEGMLGVMVDYINRVLGGQIDNTTDDWWQPTWQFAHIVEDPEIWEKAVDLINANVGTNFRNGSQNWTKAQIEQRWAVWQASQ